MTIERAIKHFKNVRDGAIAVLDSGFGNKKGESDSLYKNRKLYAELAIAALEKQLPKKPYEDFPVLFCPVCWRVVYPQIKYCPDCGQALDWRNDEK